MGRNHDLKINFTKFWGKKSSKTPNCTVNLQKCYRNVQKYAVHQNHELFVRKKVHGMFSISGKKSGKKSMFSISRKKQVKNRPYLHLEEELQLAHAFLDTWHQMRHLLRLHLLLLTLFYLDHAQVQHDHAPSLSMELVHCSPHLDVRVFQLIIRFIRSNSVSISSSSSLPQCRCCSAIQTEIWLLLQQYTFWMPSWRTLQLFTYKTQKSAWKTTQNLLKNCFEHSARHTPFARK